MKENYRFRIQAVLVGRAKQFQLRVGMAGDFDAECIPVYQSAFAQTVRLEPAHSTVDEAHLELSRLLLWLDSRRG